ncbi:MAG: hypothetical protein KKD05_08195 [Candidatus Omnitrophica bacterium]|nr:hypothetical protein [Candidatus Omnitrophota bacterium]
MKLKQIILSFTFFAIICLLPIKVSADAKKDVLLNKHCSSCHASERVFNIEKTSTGWAKTVNWMRKNSNNAFSQKQAQLITQNIINLHPNYAKQLFQIRCAKCHEWQTVEKLKLSPQQWNRLILRERAKAITWISLDEAKDISEYLAKTYSSKISTNKTEPIRDRVEKKCIHCHIHSTVFKPVKTVDQWISVNNRMQQKSPTLINDNDLLEISEYLSKVNPLPEWQ